MKNVRIPVLFPLVAMALPTAALAQDSGEEAGPPIALEDSVFSGDYLSIGAGVAISPSYTGSDDYVFNVLPILQGSLGGVEISPRAAGVTLDFVQDPAQGVGLDLGISARLRSNRAMQISEIAGAFAGLAMGINALVTAASLPLIWGWLTGAGW